MATIRVFPYLSPRIIEVQAPTTEISVQVLSNLIKDWEDEPSSLPFPILIKTSGKQSLGGGVLVGITAELQNAQVSFQARDGTDDPPEVACTITGGNLVAIDENSTSINAIYPTAYTQVVIAQSSSATIATPPSDTNLLYLVESLRGTHSSIGNVFYWDPTGGSNSNDGTTPVKAVFTFAQAQTLCANGNNDIIFALSTFSSGITTVTETITITVPTLKLRGPGYPFQFVPGTDGTADTITISADSVEVSGFYIKTGTEGTYNGITISAGSDNALIKDCWISTATGNGIALTGGSTTTRTTIDTCAIEDCVGDGINIGDYTTRAKIKQCILSGNDNGAVISGSNSRDNTFENNLIYNNSTYGIDIGTGVTRTGVRTHNTFSRNGPTPPYDQHTLDNGTDTFIESAGAVSDQNIIDIVDAVWDEVISSTYHTDANSAGKTLRDAKTKATLASLK